MLNLKIELTTPDGASGSDCDVYNPFARAHRNLFETGQPFERLLACYLDPRPFAVGLRWFGMFVISDGGRILYFPGTGDPQSLTLSSQDQDAVKTHQLEVDHFTLESNRREWHVTGNGKKGHLGRFRTADLGEDRTLWFGLSIGSPEILRLVRIYTEVNGQTPPADTLRRADVALKAREGIDFNVLLFDWDQQPPAPTFGHFAVIVGPPGFESYRGSNLGLPFGSPFVALGDLRRNTHFRSHRLRLDPHLDMEIVTALLPGRVSVPVALTSPFTSGQV